MWFNSRILGTVFWAAICFNQTNSHCFIDEVSGIFPSCCKRYQSNLCVIFHTVAWPGQNQTLPCEGARRVHLFIYRSLLLLLLFSFLPAVSKTNPQKNADTSCFVNPICVLSFTGTTRFWSHVTMRETASSQHCRGSGLKADGPWIHTHEPMWTFWIGTHELMFEAHQAEQLLRGTDCTQKHFAVSPLTFTSSSTQHFPGLWT